MATHFNPRASQAPIRAKNLFQKIGETVGQLLGFVGGPTQKIVNRRDTYGPVPYSKSVQASTRALYQGKTRGVDNPRVPDSVILSFLDQIRTNGINGR